MRLLLTILGFVLGVATTLAYAFFGQQAPAPAASPLPANPSVTVTLSQAFLSEMISRAVEGMPAPAPKPTDLRTELRDDTLLVHGQVDVLGRATTATATMRPVLRDGKLRIDVLKAEVGAMPLPSLDSLVETQMNERLSGLLSGMPVRFTGVRVDPARGLTITCQVDLDALEPAQTVAR